MSLVEILGYAAAVLLLASYAVKGMDWLRMLALAGSIALAAYALVAANWIALGIAVLMILVNLWRLLELRRLGETVKAATAGAGAPITVDWLLPHMSKEDCPKGTIVFRKGEAAEAMYFVESGRVRIEELGVEIGKGSLFGEIGVLSYGQERTATAVCAERTTLLRISAEKVRELYFQNPEFGFFLVGMVTNRLMEDLQKANAGKKTPPPKSEF